MFSLVPSKTVCTRIIGPVQSSSLSILRSAQEAWIFFSITEKMNQWCAACMWWAACFLRSSSMNHATKVKVNHCIQRDEKF